MTAIVGSIIVIASLGVVGSFGGGMIIKKARTLQAKAVTKGLEIAIKGYQTEYLKLPFAGPAAPSIDTSYSSADPGGNALIDVLLGTDLKNNPRQIHFWEPPNSKSGGAGYTLGVGLIDPWRMTGYRIILDYDKDSHITDPEGIRGSIKEDVLIYSAGPDGDFATWKDNVCSWK
jgi:hypothetical protein